MILWRPADYASLDAMATTRSDYPKRTIDTKGYLPEAVGPARGCGLPACSLRRRNFLFSNVIGSSNLRSVFSRDHGAAEWKAVARG